jgi:RNA polymerase sigma factor (sigma-70 family)
MASEPASPATESLRPIAGPPAEAEASDRHLLERFVTVRDEAAFAGLVQRHGPMVLGVCRRLLHDAQEAEDAFQATFLVLVHKAATIGRPHLLGPWLHGVACRIAGRARQAARRRAREREVAAMPDRDPSVEAVWRELRQVLDEELGRLAHKYRAPLVLVYLEGKTTEEAARLLGCPRGTVLSRLARGRDRLRDRLARRGMTLSVWTLVLVLVEKAAPAAVPQAVAEGTTQAAVLTAAGKAAGAVPATVAAWTKGELQAMFLSKVKVLTAVALALFAAAATAVGARALADKPAAADKKADAKDEEKILGTWDILSIEEGGQKMPAEALKGATLVMDADGKWVAKKADDEQSGTYELDPARKPKEIRITNTRGQSLPGIYKLDGDRLTICVDKAGARPTEFVSKEGTRVYLSVLKRQKK